MKTMLLSAAVAAVAFAAVPASAVVVTGATKIEITSTTPTYLQIGELQAFNFANSNVAAASNGGSAIGSSVYSPDSNAGKAIDGDFTNLAYPNIFHSAGAASNEYLDVSFAAANLSSITIFGRSDCCTDRDIYNVKVFNAAGATLYSGTLNASIARTHSATVTFDAAAGVPEPASWMLMITGFGLVGVGVRSRRRNAVAA